MREKQRLVILEKRRKMEEERKLKHGEEVVVNILIMKYLMLLRVKKR